MGLVAGSFIARSTQTPTLIPHFCPFLAHTWFRKRSSTELSIELRVFAARRGAKWIACDAFHFVRPLYPLIITNRGYLYWPYTWVVRCFCALNAAGKTSHFETQWKLCDTLCFYYMIHNENDTHCSCRIVGNCSELNADFRQFKCVHVSVRASRLHE